MDPMEFVRTLRRRWLIILTCAALGAVLGYASTLLQDEETGPIVQHWAAGEILVLNPDTEVRLDLQRLAPFVTKGDIPAAVADRRGMDVIELESRLRTIADFSKGTFTIQAVATSAEDARDIALEIREELLTSLSADAEERFNEQISTAEELVLERAEAVVAIDDQINALSTSQDVERRSLESQRTAATLRLTEAQEALRDLERAGPTEAELIPLEIVPPLRISAREFNNRIARARQGENNYTFGEVELADTSSPTVSERLESPIARAFLGSIAGAVLAMMAIGIHYKLDPRLRTREQFERAFGLPVLTTIPNFPRKERKENLLHARENPRSAVAEAYRYLRSVLLFARSGMSSTDAPADIELPATESTDERAERDVRVVMVTSAGEGEGKTTTAANLAVLLAESGYDTMFVNCDFRLPSAHKLLGVDYEPGSVSKTGIPNLRFVSDVKRSDDDTPGQVSERQRRLISRARELVDVVVLDTAPLLATNDAIDIMPETDLAVLVAREGKTTGAAAAEARELVIDRLGVPVAGVVITAGGSGLGGGYYEKYRYGSYFNRDAPSLFNVAKQLLFGAKKAPKDHMMPDERFEPASDPVYLPGHADGDVDEPMVLDADTDPIEGIDDLPTGGEVFSMHDLQNASAVVYPDPAVEPQLPFAHAAHDVDEDLESGLDDGDELLEAGAHPKLVHAIDDTEKDAKASDEPPTFQPAAPPVADEDPFVLQVVDVDSDAGESEADEAASNVDDSEPVSVLAEAASDEIVLTEDVEAASDAAGSAATDAESGAGADSESVDGDASDNGHATDAESDIDLRFQDWLAKRNRAANADAD